MRRLFFACGTRDSTASTGILFLRVSVGLMMLLGHGLPKLLQFQELSADFYTPDFIPLQWMSSTVSLSACIAAELGAAALLVIGLATRPAAFLLGFTMVVAAFAKMASRPWFFDPAVVGCKELALLYLIPAITLILTGAGAFSLDALIDKERRGSRMRISF